MGEGGTGEDEGVPGLSLTHLRRPRGGSWGGRINDDGLGERRGKENSSFPPSPYLPSTLPLRRRLSSRSSFPFAPESPRMLLS